MKACFVSLPFFLLFLRKGSLFKLFSEHQHARNDSLLSVKHLNIYIDESWSAYIRIE